MCRLAWESGCRTVIATPHLRRDQWPDRGRGDLRQRLAAVRDVLDVPLELDLGAEIRVDSELVRELVSMPDEEQPTLAHSNALLLELEPRGIGPDPVELVRELIGLGFRPVIAHPELTPCVRSDLGLAAALVEAGAALQVTAMSVTGELGRSPRAAVARLLDAGIVHAVASDAHRPDWRPPGLARARAELARHWGEEVAAALTEENARSLLAVTRRRVVGQEVSG